MEDKNVWGIQFAEHMGGYYMEGMEYPVEGYNRGKTEGHPVDFWVKIHITPIVGFSRDREPAAGMTGRARVGTLGSGLEIRNGEFNIYPGEQGFGMRHISYRFAFNSDNGDPFYFSGVKNINLNKAESRRSDNVTLYSRIFRGDSEEGELYGSGILLFNLLKDGPGLFSSIRVTGTRSFPEKLRALAAFRSL